MSDGANVGSCSRNMDENASCGPPTHPQCDDTMQFGSVGGCCFGGLQGALPPKKKSATTESSINRPLKRCNDIRLFFVKLTCQSATILLTLGILIFYA